ncbi:MAG: hypothetical protein IJN48_03895 [Clostridia bacterium]|nr:hypothetical protein [Clostridia bacterium]
MRKVFPLSFLGKNFKAVILSALIYTLFIVAAAIVVFVTAFFSIPDAVYTVINILRQFILLYSASGIVIAVLNACSLLEKKQ